MTNFGDGLPPGCTDADVDKAFGYTAAEELAWASGARDRRLGLIRGVNPYWDVADLSAAWEAGYDHADKEANDGNDDAE